MTLRTEKLPLELADIHSQVRRTAVLLEQLGRVAWANGLNSLPVEVAAEKLHQYARAIESGAAIREQVSV